jgi:hypothetical protein
MTEAMRDALSDLFFEVQRHRDSIPYEICEALDNLKLAVKHEISTYLPPIKGGSR